MDIVRSPSKTSLLKQYRVAISLGAIVLLLIIFLGLIDRDTLFEQLLLNLLKNANEAMQEKKLIVIDGYVG